MRWRKPKEVPIQDRPVGWDEFPWEKARAERDRILIIDDAVKPKPEFRDFSEYPDPARAKRRREQGLPARDPDEPIVWAEAHWEGS